MSEKEIKILLGIACKIVQFPQGRDKETLELGQSIIKLIQEVNRLKKLLSNYDEPFYYNG